MTDINGSRALITGAASGIGRLLARELGKAGASLALWDIDAEGLSDARAELRSAGCDVDIYVCDLTRREVDISPAEIERTFQVNTLALFWTAKAFLPGMLERDRGHLVTIASAAGLAGTSKLTDYCSSKFAAVGFDESLRVELKRQGSRIVTTVVCPFYTDTGMFEGVRTRFPWLLPILDPEYVVRRTLRAIEKDRRRLVMPRFVYTGWPSRLLPVDWFDAMMAFFGISHSMDDFRGRG
jgi:all-trans-retinol dehydrogenase (NAD+)